VVKNKTSKLVFAYSTIGLQLAATIFVFVYGGYWLDGRVNSEPWFLLLGTAIGLTVGFVNLFKELKSVDNNTEKPGAEEKSRRKWL